MFQWVVNLTPRILVGSVIILFGGTKTSVRVGFRWSDEFENMVGCSMDMHGHYFCLTFMVDGVWH